MAMQLQALQQQMAALQSIGIVSNILQQMMTTSGAMAEKMEFFAQEDGQYIKEEFTFFYEEED